MGKSFNILFSHCHFRNSHYLPNRVQNRQRILIQINQPHLINDFTIICIHYHHPFLILETIHDSNLNYPSPLDPSSNVRLNFKTLRLLVDAAWHSDDIQRRAAKIVTPAHLHHRKLFKIKPKSQMASENHCHLHFYLKEQPDSFRTTFSTNLIPLASPTPTHDDAPSVRWLAQELRKSMQPPVPIKLTTDQNGADHFLRSSDFNYLCSYFARLARTQYLLYVRLFFNSKNCEILIITTYL